MTAVAATVSVTPVGDRQILITRTFNAPRMAVYEAFTSPAVLKQWLGPHGFTLTRAEVDSRVGGRYRFEGEFPGQTGMGWGGVIRELTPGRRVVQTEAFDAYPGEAINTTTWDEQDGKTLLRVQLEYASTDVRDAVLASGMEKGVEASYDRLERLLGR